MNHGIRPSIGGQAIIGGPGDYWRPGDYIFDLQFNPAIMIIRGRRLLEARRLLEEIR